MKKILLYISGLLPFFLASCEEDITLDVPPYEQKLAVYCILYPDSLPKLFLNRSRGYFDYSDNSTETIHMSGAQVVIEDVTEHTFDTLVETSGTFYFPDGTSDYLSYYQGKRKPKAGGRYKLTVTAAGKQLTGEAVLPSVINLDPSRISHTVDTFQEWNIEHVFKIRIPDPAGEENAYRVRAYEPYQEWDPWSGTVVWSEQLSYSHYQTFRKDLGKDGGEVEYEYRYYSYVGGNEPDTLHVTFEVENMNRSAGEYLESVYNQQWTTGDPFTEPIIIRHNVQGGLGVFGAAVIGNKTRIKLK